MARIFAASDSMPFMDSGFAHAVCRRHELRERDRLDFHIRFLSLPRPPQRGLYGGKDRRARRGSRGLAGTRNATKSAAGNFVCVMGGSPLRRCKARPDVTPPRIEATGGGLNPGERLGQNRFNPSTLDSYQVRFTAVPARRPRGFASGVARTQPVTPLARRHDQIQVLPLYASLWSRFPLPAGCEH